MYVSSVLASINEILTMSHIELTSILLGWDFSLIDKYSPDLSFLNIDQIGQFHWIPRKTIKENARFKSFWRWYLLKLFSIEDVQNP